MTLVSAGWASMLIAAPGLPIPLAAFLYVLGSVICHQIPERSLYVDGAQLPVCARCLGIYLGVALGSIIGHAESGERARWVLITATAPALLTIALESIGLWYPSNVVRATAGVPLGAAIAFVVAGTVRRGGPLRSARRAVKARPALHYQPCAPRRPIASKRPTRI